MAGDDTIFNAGTIDDTNLGEDAFEKGMRARCNRAAAEESPYPYGSEQHRRWMAGYRYVSEGRMAQ